ncbi:hypothetical protein H6G33_09265 [Calothrix sp. FACHB-1219]|uniref:hypothetical protein n=1 Tax=unclassified Calothrix TaxID=2619626 RepID=UPI0016855775|nr:MULTISPECIES: hypothetical protein [unclassified Calothrix]MBD2201534.1 hypothetical protein [Calothrix sp. FACHB-168]MBD2217220.1 hypothetical protein [Calothrix sp. FACHB-1219]
MTNKKISEFTTATGNELNEDSILPLVSTSSQNRKATIGAIFPNATSLIKGGILLTGDLGGTYNSPTVPGLLTKANINSPTFTGTPNAPTPSTSDSSTKIATTQYVTNLLTNTLVDATTSIKGILRLSGDLGGTASSPSVSKLGGTTINYSDIGEGKVLTYNSSTAQLEYKNPLANLVETISGHIELPLVQSYYLEVSAPYAYKVTKLSIKLNNGGGAVGLFINDVGIDSLSSITLSNNLLEIDTSLYNSLDVGDNLVLKVLSIVQGEDLIFTIKTVRV